MSNGTEFTTVETFLFTAVDFIGGGQTLTWTLFGGGTVDDNFWDVSVVARGTNNSVSLLGPTTVSTDAGGTRSLTFVTRNNTGNGTYFTRAAVRIAPSGLGGLLSEAKTTMTKLVVAYDEHGQIMAAAGTGPREADRPAERPGITLEELDVPDEFTDADIETFVHRLHVDVAGRRLVTRR
jgi:hypothetical protein